MQQAYSVIAKFYDKAMTDFDYCDYFEFVKRHLTGNVVELACGSGAFTKYLINACDNVIAVDNNREMLERAMQNNFKNRKYIQFVEQDLLEFAPFKKVDSVVCVCDGFNYIPQNKLKEVFLKIKSYLKNGGYFVFDISSEYKLKNIVGSNIFYEDNDDYTYLWTNKLQENCVKMEITVFERVQDVYVRQDEEHTQYVHSTNAVCDLLQEIGFDVEIFDGENFGEVKNNSNRILFVCKNK